LLVLSALSVIINSSPKLVCFTFLSCLFF
jgi:hypothetical protein